MGKVDRINRNTTRLFLILFELALLMRLIVLYSLIDSKFDSLLFTGISFIGMCVLLMNGLQWLKNRKLPNIWLILIILAMFVSTFMVREASLISNFKMIIWQVIYFFVIYEIGKRHDVWLLRAFEDVLFVFWSLMVTLSLILFIIKFTYTQPLDQLYYGMRLGIVQNRLYGVFVDPNYAANVSTIVSVLMIKRILSTPGTKHWFYFTAIVLHFLYIVLSGSRSVILDSSTVIFISLFLINFDRVKQNRIYLRWVKSIGVGLLGVCLFLGAGYLTKMVMPHLTIPMHVTFLNNLTEKKTENEISLEREDVGGDATDSNGRIELWESAVEIFKTSPIYGASPRNFVDYAMDKLPETKIAQTHQSPHNFVFLSMVATGLLGLIPLIIFLIIRMVNLIRYLFKTRGLKDISFTLNSMIVIQMLLFSCLMPDLIYENRIGALCFWLYLGAVTFIETSNSSRLIMQRS